MPSPTAPWTFATAPARCRRRCAICRRFRSSRGFIRMRFRQAEGPAPQLRAHRPAGSPSGRVGRLTDSQGSLYLLRMRAGAIASRVERVRERMAAAARRAGRDPESITLVGVSKTVPPEQIREAIEAGLADLGENRVQEARDKAGQLTGPIRWHLVGHLQANKANHAARLFNVVHSLNSIDILERLERAAERAGRLVMAMMQIDLAGEPTKSGAREEDLDRLLEAPAGCRCARARGLTTLPPYDPDPAKNRPYFRRPRGGFP